MRFQNAHLFLKDEINKHSQMFRTYSELKSMGLD